MRRRFMLVLMVAALLTALVGSVSAQDDDSAPLTAALDYLATVQNPDGGFSNGFAPESDLGTTADAVVAIAAAGDDPNGYLADDLQNPLTYLGVQVEAGAASGAGQLAKVITAVTAAGKDPADFVGHDLVEDLLMLQNEDGLFGMGAFDHCLSVIALQNAGAELPDGTMDTLIAAQDESGGWGFMEGEAADTNTTALCLQALAPTDSDDAIEFALAYLGPIQNEDSGWPYQNPSDFGTDSDVSSTALVVQALLANGEDLLDWDEPQSWLAEMQEDSGAFRYQEAAPGDNILATIAVVPALAEVPLNAWMPEPVAE